ncbi:hypothetical protein RB195_009324 [Necator americanus]|uniref:Transporter, DASS family n=1 Tax=Necator americanus TaxID=51031 RepID=A0ABR1CU71_NECAM
MNYSDEEKETFRVQEETVVITPSKPVVATSMVRSQKIRWTATIGATLLFSPLIYFGTPFRCVYCILLISCFWIMDVVPIGITSLLPIFLFPVLGISSAKEICKVYFKDSIVLFICTLTMALAVEETHLHRRIALKLLCKVGTRKETMLLGFLVTTSLLSFFVSDTACTALMIPIALAIIRAIAEASGTGEKSVKAYESNEELIPLEKLTPTQRAVITSTGTNLVFREIIQTTYDKNEISVSFVQWMTFAVPPVIFYLLASYVVITCSFMGPKQLFQLCHHPTKDEQRISEAIEKKILAAYKQLGDFTFAEKSILVWFFILMASWILRKPGFIYGWGDLFPNGGGFLSDSVPAVLIVFILFMWPRDPFSNDLTPILNWSVMKSKFSWSCLLLIGGGYAISEGVGKSGLSLLISCIMKDIFGRLPKLFLLISVMASITFMTEFASNVSTGSIFIPIVLSTAESLHIHPLYLALPVAVSCSFAFMLPMATPPNAVVYDTKLITMLEMASTGILLNICCSLITALNINTWTYWLFDLGTFPNLTKHHNGTINC